MKKHLVVSHYDKDVSWLNKYKDDWSIYLYSKGSNPPKNSIILENIGREPHTYLYHIITNYEEFPDIIVFCQDDPYDHAKNFDIQMNNITKLTCYYKLFILMSENFNCDWNGMPHHQGLPLIKIWEYLYGKRPRPDKLLFAAGMTYAIDKSLLLKNSKEFYEYAIKILNTNPVHHPIYSPPEPYCFERIMPYMFL